MVQPGTTASHTALTSAVRADASGIVTVHGCTLTSYERALATTCLLICHVVCAVPAFVVAAASSLSLPARVQAFLRRLAEGSAVWEYGPR